MQDEIEQITEELIEAVNDLIIIKFNLIDEENEF